MRAVTHAARWHVARSVRCRRGPAALLGPGEHEQPQRRVHSKTATTFTEQRSSIDATQPE